MADILVNANQWNVVPTDEQERIVTALRETGALLDEDRIVADPSVTPFTEDTVLEPMWNPIKDIVEGACKLACDTVAGTAAVWCTGNTGGAALVACLAIAEAARKECRKRC